MFPDLTLGRPLPVQDAIEPRESGNGYALRMVVANHLEFCDLTRALCSIGHRYLPFAAAPRIAYWFGAEPVAVARAFPRSYKSHGHLVTQLMGVEFHRPYHVRVCRPQVCVICLREQTWTRLVWDVSLVTCCAKHKTRLVDQCPSCGRMLRWRRPSVNACLCGYDLRLASGVRASDDEVWISDRIEGLLFGEAQTRVSSLDHAQCLLTPLGLDALLRVVRTLGIAAGSGRLDIVPGRMTRLLTSTEAAGVVVRAFSRLRLMLTEGRLSPEVAPIPVGEARSLCASTLGVQPGVLNDLLTRIVRMEQKQRIPDLGRHQLPLFAEEQ